MILSGDYRKKFIIIDDIQKIINHRGSNKCIYIINYSLYVIQVTYSREAIWNVEPYIKIYQWIFRSHPWVMDSHQAIGIYASNLLFNSTIQ